jgi:hypothetical protein
MMKWSLRKVVAIAGAAMAGLLIGPLLAPAHAGTFVFVTPSGSMTSGPVNAEVDFTVNPGSISITLKDLQANPTDVAQTLSDLSSPIIVEA